MSVKSTKELEKEVLSEKERQLKQPKVDLFIPKDPLNPNNTRWVCVNGVEYYLAVGKKIKVPACVADVWNESYTATQEAYDKINTNNSVD
jgi:hypothetical protein